MTKLTSSTTATSAFFVENPITNGQAIYGFSSAKGASSGSAVLGQTDGQSGTGVLGLATALAGTGSTGGPIGVSGESYASNVGFGVYGRATAQSGVAYGVFGLACSLQGAGVYAVNDNRKEEGGDALQCEGHAMPVKDNLYNLGNNRRRWKLIRGVTITPGDLVFENGVRTTEENDGLAFFNPKGAKIALLDSRGNFHIKGKVIEDL